mgnify:CR=1 FL=1
MPIAYIIDDEAFSSESLKTKILSVTDYFSEIVVFNSPFEALKAIHSLKPCIVFSDIDMPELDGISLHEQINHLDIPLIYVTAHSSYSIRAVKLQAFDYLLKPVYEDELKESIDRFLTIKKNQAEKSEKETIPSFSEISALQKGKFTVSSLEQIQIVTIENVVYLSAENNYTKIYLVDGSELMAPKTLKYFEEKLEDYGFVRVHKSFLVNLLCIVELSNKDGSQIILSNGHKVALAKDKKNLVLEFFKQL